MIYGANGFSGRAIAERLVAAGHEIVLAGRHATEVTRLARSLGAPCQVFDLRDTARIVTALGGVFAVLHAAGPFAETASPMMEACVRAGVHYLDISGEWPVFAEALRRGPDAIAAQVMLMPGVGSTIVVSDCLLAMATMATPGVSTFRIAHSFPGVVSRGTMLSAMSLVSAGVVVRRKGELVRTRLRASPRWFDFGEGERRCVAVSAPEVVTGQQTTGVGNLEVYLEVPLGVEIGARAGALAEDMFGDTLWRTAARPVAGLWPERPHKAVRPRAGLAVVVEAEDTWRRVTRFGLRTSDGYTVTTDTAHAVVERVLAGRHSAGFQTPAGLFGPELIRDLGYVRPLHANPLA